MTDMLMILKMLGEKPAALSRTFVRRMGNPTATKNCEVTFVSNVSAYA
jgi:hypothetical protein